MQKLQIFVITNFIIGFFVITSYNKTITNANVLGMNKESTNSLRFVIHIPNLAVHGIQTKSAGLCLIFVWQLNYTSFGNFCQFKYEKIIERW